ncbi:3-hexulose-6-phosphate isomerase-like [Telopea speciosissima]|uniref:3-hexulose-6-phosphate isomerase-like n=1 Tax=Telopea speciosissima TaxID=54955 RepID=UPI001CC525D4|nr:3-hexulose-6-phosphate isomerase-like [Telopea speciosissima]
MAEQNNSMSSMASEICNQIQSVFTQGETEERTVLEILVEEIASAAGRNGRIFFYACGREGLMLKALCMRLAHLGLSVHVVADMTTPPISSNDLLVASAGPGGISTVDAICGVARSNGARVLFLTAQPKSESATKYATVIGFIPAQTMADDHQPQQQSSTRQLLPMGSLFEGVMFVLFEMVVFRLAEVLGQTPEAIRARHTNLE